MGSARKDGYREEITHPVVSEQRGGTQGGAGNIGDQARRV